MIIYVLNSLVKSDTIENTKNVNLEESNVNVALYLKLMMTNIFNVNECLILVVDHKHHQNGNKLELPDGQVVQIVVIVSMFTSTI